MVHKILVITLASVAASCGPDPVRQADDPSLGGRSVAVRAAAGDTIRLHPGEVAEIGSGPDRLRVAFSGIVGDSRCPRGVECIWSGDATAMVELSLPSTPWSEAELHTHLEPREIGFGGYTVTLLEVEPYPVSGETIEPEDYVAVLTTER